MITSAVSTRLLLAAASVAAFGVWGVQISHAEFAPVELVSKSPREQAEFADETVISADGRYVAFCAGIGGKAGIFREQLSTRQLEPVSVVASTGQSGCGGEVARAPSVSADGRYVSFTTGQALDELRDTNHSSDVYVADMDNALPSYELASTADGSTAMEGGSVAAGRVAMSADGSRVAFVNKGNVYVRELNPAPRTILISAKRNPIDGAMTEDPVEGGGAFKSVGASISADGSTVAWSGERLPEQVPLLGEEEQVIRGIEAAPEVGSQNKYREPLWRRVPGDGNDPPTRRMVGGGDPLAPGCPAGGTLADPACQGPYPEIAKRRLEPQLILNEGFGWGTGLPQLSANGDLAVVTGDPEEVRDLFLVDMDSGLDRKEAVRPLTKWFNPRPDSRTSILEDTELYPYTGSITDLAISADGSRIAFTTVRQHFLLPSPTLVTPIPAAVNVLAELYQVDLNAETIQRVTPGPGRDVSLGSGSGAGADSLSYSGEGGVLAFSSGAYNLAEGDANEASDAFVVESPPSPAVRASAISAPPASLVLHPRWSLSARAASQPNGTVKVLAVVPGPGTTRARAKAQIGLKLRTHRVAAAAGRARAGGVVRLTLRLGRHLRPQARQRGGLASTVAVAFTGPGGKPLHATVDATFKVFKRRARDHEKSSVGGSQ